MGFCRIHRGLYNCHLYYQEHSRVEGLHYPAPTRVCFVADEFAICSIGSLSMQIRYTVNRDRIIIYTIIRIRVTSDSLVDLCHSNGFRCASINGSRAYGITIFLTIINIINNNYEGYGSSAVVLPEPMLRSQAT